MATRKDELDRVLHRINQEIPDPDWVALVDGDGLIVACVPDLPAVDIDAISAMTAASFTLGQRVLQEVDGGNLRYVIAAGSQRQHICFSIRDGYLLSISLKPEVPAHATFRPLSRWLPNLLAVLQMRLSES
ncbi:MAG: roadblock/LC7 domain-containing protein [Anaerolineales bacterium]|nr:roadblock/LC7 domain-containing protein [Anaerolineales bacterium]